ncbi:MAG: DUF2628 domain-containing protein [Rickettsia endosymbiont of Bryobia graminum]|nr:DUF2628 domain-containing protein [Rickettsia endosymbiont of Bryobia graminum]
MNIYSIYVNPDKKDNNFILVKQGFSLFAAVFNIFWALYHRMWLALIITLILNIAIFSVDSYNLSNLTQIVIVLIFGFFGADMREYDLERKQYSLEDIILADSEIEAELKFLERAYKE